MITAWNEFYAATFYAMQLNTENTINTSEKLQAETACELHFAIDIFGPPFTIKRGPYATLLSVVVVVYRLG